MKKPFVLIFVLFSFFVVFSACDRRPAEEATVTQPYESTTEKENLISAETFTEAPSAVSTTAAAPSAQSQPSSQSPAVLETTAMESTTLVIPTVSDTTGTVPAAPTEAFEVRRLNTERDGLSIYGNLYLPKTQEQKLPAVILSHSANMTSDSMKSYCERIAGMGFAAYSFDFCGASPQSRSDGKQSDMTVFTEVEDLKAVLQMIKGLDFVDSRNIFLFGTSQGGLVSALVAAEFPTDIKGLILFYPAFNIPETVQKYAKLMPQTSLSPYITTLLDYDVYGHISPYKGDVLIVHGTTDFVVPYSYSEKADQVYEHCELHLIKGATHGFNADNYVSFGNFDGKTWAYAESFLKEHYD